MRFVIDEDMPKSLTLALIEAGHEALDIRDQGLRGASDEKVFQFAQQHAACVITEDLGFANVLRFPLGEHHGIIVGRFSSRLHTQTVVTQILQTLETLTETEIHEALVIVEIGQCRIRRL